MQEVGARTVEVLGGEVRRGPALVALALPKRGEAVGGRGVGREPRYSEPLHWLRLGSP